MTKQFNNKESLEQWLKDNWRNIHYSSLAVIGLDNYIIEYEMID